MQRFRKSWQQQAWVRSSNISLSRQSTTHPVPAILKKKTGDSSTNAPTTARDRTTDGGSILVTSLTCSDTIGRPTSSISTAPHKHFEVYLVSAMSSPRGQQLCAVCLCQVFAAHGGVGSEIRMTVSPQVPRFRLLLSAPPPPNDLWHTLAHTQQGKR